MKLSRVPFLAALQKPKADNQSNGTFGRSYADWSQWIEKLERADNDELLLSDAKGAQVSWSSGVAEAFVRRMDAAFDARLKRCSDQLERNLSAGSDETNIVRTLLDARRQLAFLDTVAGLDNWDPQLRNHLKMKISSWAGQAQSSMEAGATRARADQVARTIRTNPLTSYANEAGFNVQPGPRPATRRQILTEKV